MNKIGLVVLSIAIGCGWSTTAMAKHCTISSPFNLTSEGPWPATGTVRSDGYCDKGFRIGGGMRYHAGVMMFKRLYLASPPSHGRIMLREGGHFRYTPNKNYVGTDKFTLRICGLINNTESCANLEHTMNVTPAR